VGSSEAVSADTPDDALLAGMAAGDQSSAAAFVARYQSRVFGLALAMVGDRTQAEDVAQEAFLRVWRHAPVYDARRGAVATWVLAITRNLAIDALRLRRAVPTDPDLLVDLRQPSHDRLPEEAADATGWVGPLRAAVAELPPEQRRALLLAAVYGWTAAEVGRAEQVPLGTAKTRIRTAMSATARRGTAGDEQRRASAWAGLRRRGPAPPRALPRGARGARP
jgi:RNA polymerase sigma factor (sigma-70 family)